MKECLKHRHFVIAAKARIQFDQPVLGARFPDPRVQ
jgi:hypothetical protein